MGDVAKEKQKRQSNAIYEVSRRETGDVKQFGFDHYVCAQT